jgi:hypothetical protein
MDWEDRMKQLEAEDAKLRRKPGIAPSAMGSAPPFSSRGPDTRQLTKVEQEAQDAAYKARDLAVEYERSTRPQPKTVAPRNSPMDVRKFPSAMPIIEPPMPPPVSSSVKEARRVNKIMDAFDVADEAGMDWRDPEFMKKHPRAWKLLSDVHSSGEGGSSEIDTYPEFSGPQPEPGVVNPDTVLDEYERENTKPVSWPAKAKAEELAREANFRRLWAKQGVGQT